MDSTRRELREIKEGGELVVLHKHSCETAREVTKSDLALESIGGDVEVREMFGAVEEAPVVWSPRYERLDWHAVLSQR